MEDYFGGDDSGILQTPDTNEPISQIQESDDDLELNLESLLSSKPETIKTPSQKKSSKKKEKKGKTGNKKRSHSKKKSSKKRSHSKKKSSKKTVSGGMKMSADVRKAYSGCGCSSGGAKRPEQDELEAIMSGGCACGFSGGSSKRKKSRKSKTRKSKVRKSKARKSKVRKSKARKSKARKSKARKSKARKSKVRKSKARKSKARKSRKSKARSRSRKTGIHLPLMEELGGSRKKSRKTRKPRKSRKSRKSRTRKISMLRKVGGCGCAFSGGSRKKSRKTRKPRKSRKSRKSRTRKISMLRKVGGCGCAFSGGSRRKSRKTKRGAFQKRSFSQKPRKHRKVGKSTRRRRSIVKRMIHGGLKRTNQKHCPSSKVERRSGYYRETPSGNKVFVKPKCISSKGLTPLQKRAYSKASYKYPKTRSEINLVCPNGKIPKAGYYKETRSGKRKYIKPTCITDVGRKGRYGDPGVTIIPVKLAKGILSDYGYSTKFNDLKRKKIIKNVMKDLKDPLYLTKYLNVLRTYAKNKPKLWKIYDKDMKFVQKFK